MQLSGELFPYQLCLLGSLLTLQQTLFVSRDSDFIWLLSSLFLCPPDIQAKKIYQS